MSAFLRQRQFYPDETEGARAKPQQGLPTLGRRLLAWSLEALILAASAGAPFYLGTQLDQRPTAPKVALAPGLKIAQTQIAKGLGLPSGSLPDRVTPLTNLLWSAALGLPLVVAGAHLHSISRQGRSWPKRWLGVQVLTLGGQMPGWRRALLREGLGKIGLPLAVAYGIWQVSGAFPFVAILGVLGGTAIALEGLSALGNRPRRAWHDSLAGTCVVDQHTGAIISLASLWQAEMPEAQAGQSPRWIRENGGLTSLVLSPDRSGAPQKRLNLALRLGILLLLGGLVGGSGYLLVAPRLSTPAESLYQKLIATLADPAVATPDKQVAILALGNLPGDRAAPFLASLILQSSDPAWQTAIEQALVAQGAEGLPALRRLNQNLKADLAAASPAHQEANLLHLQAVNRILASVIGLPRRDRWRSLDLRHLHLGHTLAAGETFILDLSGKDLSGTHWQGTVLGGANLSGAQFHSVGRDRHPNTYDDLVANLSGADLTNADLSGANLTLAQLAGTGLRRATLSHATLTLANLAKANLEQADLRQANLMQAQLSDARLANADMTEAHAPGANLESARLSGLEAAGANLSTANLRRAVAAAANFSGANLRETTWENASLQEAQLQGADLSGANLSGASLENADLRDIWLQEATLTDANFAGAILIRPRARGQRGFVTALPERVQSQQFVGTDFSQVRNLTPEQVATICSRGGIHPTCDIFEE